MTSLQSSAFSLQPSLQPSLLLTGAAGFLGRRVVARLVEEGVRVCAVDRVPKPTGFPSQVEYICGDAAAGIPELDEAFLLVHLAWNMDRANPDAQSESVSGFTRLLGSKNLQGVVGLGSAEEYGELEGCLSEELAPGSQLSPYGQAKHEACHALETWSQQPGRRALWLRPFIVYGPGQRGNMVIPYALRCAAERQPADFSAGTQFRDFVHVDDVANGIAQAALRVTGDGDSFAVCNLGAGKPVQVREVLERIACQTNAQELFHLGARPMREGEPREQFASVAATQEVLDWHAQIPWEAGIDALCRGIVDE